MFTLEESALLGFMLRISLGLVTLAVLAGGCAMGVHWMHAHHHHIPHPHLSLTARQA
jgi:hypothetical protein